MCVNGIWFQNNLLHIPTTTNPCNITAEEYFDVDINLHGKDIGRPKEVNTKIQKFRATLWLSEKYPLSLPEQILPIVDLMAISSSHFAKLKDFIQMQLPSGFPVKIGKLLYYCLLLSNFNVNTRSDSRSVRNDTFWQQCTQNFLCSTYYSTIIHYT